GIIGVVAKRRKLMRMGGMQQQRMYMSAVRDRVEGGGVGATVPLPGLANAGSMVAIPLVARDELIGVFVVESEKAAVFDDEDLGLIEAVAAPAGVAIQNARPPPAGEGPRAEPRQGHAPLHHRDAARP